MVDIKDKSVFFGAQSLGNFDGQSYIGTVMRLGAWSFTSGLNFGVTANGSDFKIDPNTATLPEIRNFVMTNYILAHMNRS